MDEKRPVIPDGLLDRYIRPVYRFCLSVTYCREDGEDLCQDTFLHAMERPERLAEADDPLRLLYSIALRLWRHRQQKYARRRRIAPMEGLERDVPGADGDPEERVLDRERAALLRQLTDELPERLRLPTVLYYGLDLSVAQTAQLLRLPAGTVKSRLYQARKLIGKGLKKYDDAT